jgi:NADH-quinone oxidoreductase subunit N
MTSPLDLAALAPLGFVSGGALAVMLLDGLLSSGQRLPASSKDDDWNRRRILAEARVGTALALGCATSLAFAIYTAGYGFAVGAHTTLHTARPLLLLDPLSTFASALIGIAFVLCMLLSIAYLPAVHINHRGYYGLLMLSAAGMMLVVSAVDLVVLVVGIELTTIPLYALVGLSRRVSSAEASLKLVLTGAFSSALLLYGVALLVGVTGVTDYSALSLAVSAGSAPALAGVALVFGGLGFKVMAFPFSAWAPDVLQGAPTVIASVLSVAVTTAVFVVLVRFVAIALPDATLPGVSVASPSAERLRTSLAVISGATMLVGSAMALMQTNVKRMLAHAGVAHAGMLLLGIACATGEARQAVLFYLTAHVFMVVGAFAVLISMSQHGRDCESIESFAGLGVRHPTLAAAMALFVLALAGVPGTAGFMVKFRLISSALDAGQIELVLVSIVASAMLLASYLRVPAAMYMRAPTARGTVEPASAELFVLAVCAAAVLYLGFVPDADPLGTGFRGLEVARRAASFALP